jgi:hypothetical protein
VPERTVPLLQSDVGGPKPFPVSRRSWSMIFAGVLLPMTLADCTEGQQRNDGGSLNGSGGSSPSIDSTSGRRVRCARSPAGAAKLSGPGALSPVSSEMCYKETWSKPRNGDSACFRRAFDAASLAGMHLAAEKLGSMAMSASDNGVRRDPLLLALELPGH